MNLLTKMNNFLKIIGTWLLDPSSKIAHEDQDLHIC